jgi:lipoate-protein ligase A
MLRIRLMVDSGDPFYHMAMDEALLYLRAIKAIPYTLRIYVFKPSSITFGYFQSVSSSVNTQLADKLGIPYVRRITGGGAVYHDSSGEITYSIIIDEALIPKDYIESFRYLAWGVIEAARFLGASADFVPINDGVIKGRKFSGHAQIRRAGTVMQHGTFMYNTNVDTLANLLVPHKLKLRNKGIRSIKDRVITLSQFLDREITKDDAIEALKKGFAKALNASLYEDEPSEVELHLANAISWKYKSKEWTFLRP